MSVDTTMLNICDIACEAKSEFPFCLVLHVGRLSVLMDSDENN